MAKHLWHILGRARGQVNEDKVHEGRRHLSLGPGIPEPAAVFLPLQGHGRHSLAQDCQVVACAVLGGLHHEYQWETIAAVNDQKELTCHRDFDCVPPFRVAVRAGPPGLSLAT